MMKPPYRVPSMAEIDALPWNGGRVVSTFSGAGGSCLGYRMAGFRVVWANEFVPAAQDTYRANHAETYLDTRDIRDVKASEIMAVGGFGVGELDLFDGSPPCSSFSLAGKREESWGQVKKYSDVEQRTDDLFFEYVRLLRDLQPKTFVAENVAGLVRGVARGYFKEIITALRACGYVVACKLLDAQWLGVPQARQRTIFVGVRTDLGKQPAHPTPFAYRYSIRDAVPWLDGLQVRGGVRSADAPAPTILTHGNPHTWNEMMPVVSGRTGQVEGAPTPPTGGVYVTQRTPSSRRLGRAAGERRVSVDQPSPTLCASGMGNGFITQVGLVDHGARRQFAISELQRLCSFPDDFVLTGTYAQQWERLGRSVPPLMMRAIAATVRDRVLMLGDAGGQ